MRDSMLFICHLYNSTVVLNQKICFAVLLALNLVLTLGICTTITTYNLIGSVQQTDHIHGLNIELWFYFYQYTFS